MLLHPLGRKKIFSQYLGDSPHELIFPFPSITFPFKMSTHQAADFTEYQSDLLTAHILALNRAQNQTTESAFQTLVLNLLTDTEFNILNILVGICQHHPDCTVFVGCALADQKLM